MNCHWGLSYIFSHSWWCWQGVGAVHEAARTRIWASAVTQYLPVGCLMLTILKARIHPPKLSLEIEYCRLLCHWVRLIAISVLETLAMMGLVVIGIKVWIMLEDIWSVDVAGAVAGVFTTCILTLHITASTSCIVWPFGSIVWRMCITWRTFHTFDEMGASSWNVCHNKSVGL